MEVSSSDYIELYEDLKDQIKRGIKGPGDKLPQEKDLLSMTGLNRSSVRKAIRRLIDEGFAFPVRNRGIFVSMPKYLVNFQKESSYTINMNNINEKPKVKLLELSTVSPTKAQKELFSLKLEDKLWEIKVLRYYRDIPFIIGLSYIPYSLAPEFNIHYKNMKSIHLVLKEKYNITPIRQNSQFVSGFSTREESRLLAIYDGTPTFKVHSTNVDENGNIIEDVVSTYRSDLVRFNFNP